VTLIRSAGEIYPRTLGATSMPGQQKSDSRHNTIFSCIDELCGVRCMIFTDWLVGICREFRLKVEGRIGCNLSEAKTSKG